MTDQQTVKHLRTTRGESITAIAPFPKAYFETVGKGSYRLIFKPFILILISLLLLVSSQALGQSSGSITTQNDPLTWTDPVDENHDACEFDDVTLSAAQARLDANLAQWTENNTNGFNISGGCSPVLTNDFTSQSIDYCAGGVITVTWTINDQCEGTITVQATYTLTPPTAITWTSPIDYTSDACTFDAPDIVTAQAYLDADLSQWVMDNQNAFAVAGACSPEVTNDFINQLIDYCEGGSITITWTIEDLCETITETATYTLNPPPPIIWISPVDLTIDACDLYDGDPDITQANIDAGIAQWVKDNQDAIVPAGGCTPEVTNDFVSQTLDFCTGGCVTITWTIEDLCEIQTRTATYTLVPPMPPYIYGGIDGFGIKESSDSSINSSYIAWRDSFAGIGTTNECGNPKMSFVEGDWQSDGCSLWIEDTFVVTNAAGMTATKTLVFTIIDVNPPTFSAPSDVVIDCDEDPADFNITGDVRDVFDSCNTDSVKVEYNDFRNTVVDCEGTIYRLWTATDACGNSSEVIQLIYVVPASGIDEIETNPFFRVYPNPNNGEFTVEYSGATNGEIDLYVHDIAGREMLNNNLSIHVGTNSLIINLNDSKPGVYYLLLIEDIRVTIRKIIVK